jgi:hypothetical protein
MCADDVTCYQSKTPTLKTISETFGNDIAIGWLAIQLHDLSEFSGTKDKLSIEQIDQTAKVIYMFFNNLKPEELMLFFLRFKSGEYGKFYGAVDGLSITEKLREFIDQRNAKCVQIYEEQEKQERKKRIEESEKNAMTYSDWVKSRGLPEDYLISKLFKNGMAND